MSTSTFLASSTNLRMRDIFGHCEVFKCHHGEWPGWESTEAEFVEAGVGGGVFGAALCVLLENPTPVLSGDAEFKELADLAWVHHFGPVDLSFIDPAYTKQMAPGELMHLCASFVVTDRDRRDKNALYVMLPHHTEWRITGVVEAPITAELKEFAAKVGMVYGTASMDNDYFLEVCPNGRMYLRYNQIIGSRYVGTLDAAALEALRIELTSAAAPAARSAAVPPRPPTLASTRAVKAAPVAAAGLRTMQAEMALLTEAGGRVSLPKCQLDHYDEIKRLIGQAGGRYVQGKAQFVFELGIDAREVLTRLVAGESINFKQEFQFFETPAALAVDLVGEVKEALGTLEGKRILEPSAGEGALADIARKSGADVVVIEAWNVNSLKLQAKGYSVLERDFLTVQPSEIGVFDAVIANPPFTKNQDIDHVMHMFQFVRPGGALSVIMSTGWIASEQQKHVQFREFLASQDVEYTNIESGAFKSSGTSFPTVRLDFTNCHKPSLDQLSADGAESGEDEEQETMTMAM